MERVWRGGGEGVELVVGEMGLEAEEMRLEAGKNGVGIRIGIGKI